MSALRSSRLSAGAGDNDLCLILFAVGALRLSGKVSPDPASAAVYHTGEGVRRSSGEVAVDEGVEAALAGGAFR